MFNQYHYNPENPHGLYMGGSLSSEQAKILNKKSQLARYPSCQYEDTGNKKFFRGWASQSLRNLAGDYEITNRQKLNKKTLCESLKQLRNIPIFNFMKRDKPIVKLNKKILNKYTAESRRGNERIAGTRGEHRLPKILPKARLTKIVNRNIPNLPKEYLLQMGFIPPEEPKPKLPPKQFVRKYDIKKPALPPKPILAFEEKVKKPIKISF